MKKYDILDLYVVNVNDKLFVCKKKFNKRNYKEIFSNTWFRNIDNSLVRPLKTYYGFKVIKTFATSNPVLLTEQELLEKITEINAEYVKNNKDITNKVYLDEKDHLEVLEQTWDSSLDNETEKEKIQEMPTGISKKLVKKRVK